MVEINNATLFANYAKDDLDTWKKVIGCKVDNRGCGTGTIINAQKRKYLTIYVKFNHLPAKEQVKKFTGNSFRSGYFTNIALPANLKGFSNSRSK